MSSIHPSATLFHCKPLRVLACAAAVLLAGQALTAQNPQPAGTPASATAARKSPRHRSRTVEAPPPAPQDTPPETPQPELPKWPVNDAPNKPTVVLDSSGLRIEANNSSLHDILNEVAADTGAKVEGIGADERVFGQYGPGTTSDVISQLLHGSSYNVLMIGDQGSGTPRQIVLSARRSAGNQTQASRAVPQEQPDEDVPDQPDENDISNQPPILNRPPMQVQPPGMPQGQEMPQGPPGVPRTPQQILQELQQRQQQMQDQQQQQQQPAPQP